MVNFIAAGNINITAVDTCAVINRNNGVGIKIRIVNSCANAGNCTAAGICQRHSIKPAKVYVLHVIFSIKVNFTVTVNFTITANFYLAYGINSIYHNGTCAVNRRRMMPCNITCIAAAALGSTGCCKIAVTVGVSKSKRTGKYVTGALYFCFNVCCNLPAFVSIQHSI